MCEKMKMLNGELYDSNNDEQLIEERDKASILIKKYNDSVESESSLRSEILESLFGSIGTNAIIKTPFVCDYGYNIKIGDNVFINYNCIILDCNTVEIGNNVLFAPNVQIYAATHPVDYKLRLKNLEFAKPIKIGDNVWIGGGVIICPGVTIGNNTTIGAGSVVIHDIPDNCVAVGNPCKVIKTI